jgi:hypothetical protein
VNIRNNLNVQSVTGVWDEGAHARNFLEWIF